MLTENLKTKNRMCFGFIDIQSLITTLILSTTTYVSTSYLNIKSQVDTRRDDLIKQVQDAQKPESIQKIIDQVIPAQTENPDVTLRPLNQDNLKIETYKETFLNNKAKEYLESSSGLIKFKINDANILLQDGYAEFLIASDNSRTITGRLKVSESGKNLRLYDLQLNNFGSLSVVTKLAVENLFNLKKDLVALTYHDNLERIEIKKGEVVVYLSANKK